MNPKTIKFNQDAFVAHSALPGNVSPALSNDISISGIRGEALHITSYTTGDTSGKPDGGLPDVSEAHTPKRISRKYISLQSNGKSQNAVFPQNEHETDFFWTSQGFQESDFISSKDIKNQVMAQEKGGPSRDVIGLLKQLGHSDAGEIASIPKNKSSIQEKPILVNASSANSFNTEFNNHISTSTSGRIQEQDLYNIQFDTAIQPNSVFSNISDAKKQKTARSAIDSQFKSAKKISENSFTSKQELGHTTEDDDISQSNSDVYEQVRTILGEDKHGWKQVIKTAKSAAKNTTSSNSTIGNSTLSSQENQIEQVIQKVLNQEAINRVELEHVLTHKFSGELANMQQSMNKKFQDLREVFNNFIMR